MDALTGKEYLRLSDKAKAEDVAGYLTELVLDSVKEGYSKLTVILDNCKTHNKKMRGLLADALIEFAVAEKIEVEFIDLPAYSPDFNLVEYIIHLLRLQILHHQPVGVTLEQVKERLAQHVQSRQLQTPEQIQNTLRHIWSLIA